MKLHNQDADLFIPDQTPIARALARTSHLAIGAHQDDLEFFAFHGIGQCYASAEKWFTGIVCTNGSGSPRQGPYQGVTDEEMQAIRLQEQRKAAVIGEYAAMIQLGYASSDLKDSSNKNPGADIASILAAARPEVVYLHNPADKHDSHITTLLRSLEAIRSLPAELRPRQAWGCEIWRSLDWLCDEDKELLPCSERTNLQAALNGVFDSQISGGKRYDLAVMGRRLANATFLDPHLTDQETGLTYAMDLSAVIQDENLDLVDYTLGLVDKLKGDIRSRLEKFL